MGLSPGWPGIAARGEAKITHVRGSQITCHDPVGVFATTGATASHATISPGSFAETLIAVRNARVAAIFSFGIV